jgi:hypothetical protein
MARAQQLGVYRGWIEVEETFAYRIAPSFIRRGKG